MKESKTLKWTFISVGGIIVFLISFTIIYELLIPDICYYHTNEMNPFMNLFYSAGGGSNGHPEPNFLNFLVSIFVGGFIGYKVFKLVMKKNK